jgi:predicted enzyme related to lactoylglutathione lyase
MIQGLRTAVYKVADLEIAKEWYSRILGFGPYFDQPFYVGYNVGGFELGLDPDVDGVTVGSNLGIYWGVTDLLATLSVLKDAGVEIHSQPQEVGDGIIVASVLDPFGNEFGMIQNPNFDIGKAT